MSLDLSRAIKISGLIFPFVYILANVLSRFSNIEIVKYFYTAMSIGGGIAFYLLIGACILVVLLLSYKILGRNLPINIPYVVLSLATIASVIGLIQARTIQKISYEVSLENLPPEWEGKKAILFSDSHYGLINHAKAAKRLASLLNSENPDMVFIAGDLFDGPHVDTEPLIKLWKEMSLKYPVFYAPGNHEEYGDYQTFIKDIKAGGFIVLEDDVVDHEGVSIVGFKYRSKNGEQEIETLIKSMNLQKSSPIIVINHSPIFQKTLEENGVNLMFSGHTHRGQFWPLRYITKAIYGKYHYGFNNYKNLQTITTSGVGTAGPPFRLLNTPEIIEVIFKSL